MSDSRNANGCLVAQRCCSCAYSILDREGWRRCTLHAFNVRPDNTCSRWMMRPALDRAGNKTEEGQIKKLDYLMHVMAVRDRERTLCDQNLMKREECLTLEQIRQQWETENKQSIYMDI